MKRPKQQGPEIPRLRYLSFLFATLTVLTGGLVLMGWQLNVTALKSLHPEFVSMKVNTALAFVFAGVALLLIQQNGRFRLKHNLAVIFSSGVALIGLLTLLQYLFGLNLGIDELLFRDVTHEVGTYAPGRMALNTAIGFVLLGAALLLLLIGDRWQIRVSQAIALLLILLSLIPMLGYAYRAPELYGFAVFTQMALHTALAFVLISSGVLLARPAKGFLSVLGSNSLGGFMARRIIPLALIIPVFLVVLRLTIEISRLGDLGVETIFFSVALILLFMFLAWRFLESINMLDGVQKEKEEELRSWQELMQIIIRHDPNAIAVHDKNLNYIYVSERYLNDYNVKDKDILGKHHYDVFPDIPEKWRKIHRRALAGEVIRSEEDCFLRQDGKTDYTRWECRPWYERNGEVGGIILYTEVITERKNAEMEKVKLNKQLFQLVDAIKRLSTAQQEKEVHQVVAAAARKLAGAEATTFVIKDNNHCFYAEENTVNPLWKGGKFPLQSCITGWSILNKKQVVIEDIYKDERIPHDLYRPTFVKSLAVLPVQSQDPRGAIGCYWGNHHKPSEKEMQLLQSLADAAAITLENIQLIQTLEDRVEERTHQLEAANKELEAFSYSVSHDLRAPLRAIDGFSRILLEDHVDQIDDDAKRLFGVIQENTQRMGRLIDDLLAFSRLSRYEMKVSHIEMKTLVNSLYHEVADDKMRQRIDFKVGEIEDTKGDPTMIRQLWINLISNAVKFSSKKERALIQISGKKNKNIYEYCIRDNGEGFDMQYVDKIFGVFQRLHSMRDFEGTGVGLAIVQRIVHRHGGTIRAEGEPGKGAAFYVSLPLIQ